MLMNIYATLYQYNGMHQINVIPSEQKILRGWGAVSFRLQLDKDCCDKSKKRNKNNHDFL